MTKRTKIVCTLGPAVDNESTLRNLILAGMNVARINVSHGNHEEHRARISRLKKIRRELQLPVAILFDTRGPEVRTGCLVNGEPITLYAGNHLTLCEEGIDGTAERIQQSYAGLSRYVEPGTPILLDDGLIELVVDETQGSDIVCTVQNTGVLSEHKSVNLPDTTLDFPALTDLDKQDIVFAIEQDVDFLAASFVRNADDVKVIRQFLDANGGSHIQIIAKVENTAAVENIEGIIDASDGVMVARGDLGVEIPSSRVPHIQKAIINLCNKKAKPVITATQMLDSMMRNPRPTRAEVADVANAIYDGTDALMLSGETAIGKYPVPTVRMMARIAEETEPYVQRSACIADMEDLTEARKVALAVGMAAVETADVIGAAGIIAPTTSGRTARLMSNLRPKSPIFAVTSDSDVMRALQLSWGVEVLKADIEGDMRSTVDNARRAVCDRNLLKTGDLAVLTAGDYHTAPIWVRSDLETMSAPTNVMYVVKISDDGQSS